MGGSMFVGDHLLLDVSFDAARARLGRLAGDGVLLGASECAYGEGITGLAEAAGPVAGLSRLAGVRPGDLIEKQGCARLWLRWDAIGPDGAVFPALDADLTLSPAGAKTTALTLAGVYRLPGQAGAALDPAIVRCFAAVTVRSFIARLGCALAHPAGTALPVLPAGQNFPQRTAACAQLAAWRAQYPHPAATAEHNAAVRADEGKWLARFAGVEALDREQVIELIGWKFRSMPHRKARALSGVSSERWRGRPPVAGAADVIRSALAAAGDYRPLLILSARTGIFGFGPAMGSVILAACHPQEFTIADTRALKSLRALGLMPAGPRSFRLKDWEPYLSVCRSLARSCQMSLREVNQALWVAADDPVLLGNKKYPPLGPAPGTYVHE